jgi:hypothetical protein
MRLTLRTMLAYLDGILEPEDTQDIAKKIEESPFASDLIHRIRDLMRRPSIDAPDSTSPGPSLGPNAVAEYLDNTLPPARVTEFEKICLDSDIYLAEVSACHQILTLVLGEPAEIEPASRQRMYDIHAQYAQPPVDEISLSSDSQTEIVLPPPAPAFSALSSDTAIVKKTHARPTIPEYLREPDKKNRWVSIATACVLAVCLLIVVLMALGRFEPGTTMGNMLVSLGVVKENKQVAAETNKAVPQPIKSQSDTSAKPKPEEKAIGGKSTPSTAKTAPPALPAAESEKPSGAEQPTSTASPPGEPEKPFASEKNLLRPRSPTETTTAGTVTEPATAAQNDSTSKTAVDQDQNKGGNTIQETAKPPQAQTDSEPAGTDVASTDIKPSEEKTPAPSEQMGRFTSEDQLLLTNSGAATDWQRVASRGILSANEQLLALPTYRPEITVDTSVKLQMLGGAELELLPSNAREPEGIKIRFGRIVVAPLANAGTKLRLIAGDRTGVITFVDPDAVLAAEVRRIHTPGVNPETESDHITAEIFVAAGHIVWDETGQKSLEIAAPARFIIDKQSAPETATFKDLPWITAEPISQIDHRASETMVQELLSKKPPTRPAQRGLMEMAKHRQKEVCRLAIRCLGYIGYFDPMVTVLNDAASKQDWAENINQLREAVARDPETAIAVRKALESRYPQEADDMYRMLWGYSDKNLESGDDEKLVKFLEDENLAMRVLSIWNLKEIRGGGGQFYQPEQPVAKRQQPIRSWKKSLEAKEIRIKPVEEKNGNTAPENAADVP